jgi:hypothetical protein
MASEMSEFWKDFNCASQGKRHSNLKNSTELLLKSGFPFVSKNNGVHLIVMDRYDYWPSTGLFIDRLTSRKYRGINQLLKMIRRS